VTEQKKLTIDEAHLAFARSTNNRVWALLEKKGRIERESDELLYAAHASCYHWLHSGTAVHQQRGEYLIAKVYLSLAVPERAVHHARRCLAITEQHSDEMKDFDVAFAYEGLARALAMEGNKSEAHEYYRLARQAGDRIQNAEDKEIFDGDLARGDWFGLFTRNSTRGNESGG
jgi:tetratricopeptide (TPR) repeat protein